MYETYLKNLAKKYSKTLLVNTHTFSISKGVEIPTSYFDIATNYPYLNCSIGYSETSFEDWKKGNDVRPNFAHEIAHAIVAPLKNVAEKRYTTKSEISDHMERLTDHIAMIMEKNNLL